ncbi:MAG: SCP2 sterol-binding domain-containing protein [Cardiobacteriaceae bacterium]|nr:SCP2 sterol-binding domain-containing protein [Cardiobacteriaceae bacterium]
MQANISSAVEFALNQALQLDPTSHSKLSELNNTSVAISLEDFSDWIFVVEGGSLRNSNKSINECDLKLSGNIGGFLDLFRSQDAERNPKNRLYIEGDVRTAQKFQQVMGRIKPDFDAVLRARLGEEIGGAAASIFSTVKEQGGKFKNTAQTAVDAWLMGEKSPFVGREEFDVFVAKLRVLEDKIRVAERNFSAIKR